ncbi:IS3 family transposase [Secundilactobacillus collinoides]|uniref:IS3 family transposase n=1 Tax=Secundilactobacillus collinoides TaxID=33960 RepID=UPI000AD0F82E|nr:IS3 family transposase [Secundilactobacillus collinoides]
MRQNRHVSLKEALSFVPIAKSTYEYNEKHPATEPVDESQLIADIEQVHKDNPSYGAVRITDELHNQGQIINHKRVLRITKQHGWTINNYHKQVRKYNSYKGEVGELADNLLNQRFFTDRPYQKLTSDVSEFRFGGESMKERVYLAPIMDLFSDRILTFGISNHPTVNFVLEPLKEALGSIPKGLGYRTTVHTDQGFQDQNYRWVDLLKSRRIFQSMSRKATCYDNAPMEAFFSIMKAEMMTNHHYETKRELITAMKKWIKYYNEVRIKHNLGGKSPVQYCEEVVRKAA